MELHNIIAASSGGVVEKLTAAATKTQETFQLNSPLLIAQTVNFLIVAYVLYRFAFKPLMTVIEARQKKMLEPAHETGGCKTFPLRMVDVDPSITTETDLRTLCKDFLWPVHSVHLKVESCTAFINFTTEQNQRIAFATLKGMLWKGTPIRFSRLKGA